ncbi:MAG: hypothetical protein J6C09_03790 [Clostridia bacterium]|nr:hypothetical protein [Clostridia bacterium]
MKKLLTLLLLTLTLIFALASCQIGDDSGDGSGDGSGSGNSGGTGDSGTSGTPTADVIWSPTTNTVIVSDEPSSKIDPLQSHLSALTGKSPTLEGPNSQKSYNEIIVGKADRTLSDVAYRRLSRYADENVLSDRLESAYIIVAEDGSLAIAYSDLYARDAAIEYITENLKSSTLSVEGTIYRNTFNTLDFVNEKNQEQREAGFAKLEPVMGESAVDALRGLYSLYTSDIYMWLVNLYDPEIGGFYYSESARNNVGYLPDIESTAQALGILDTSGMTDSFNVNADSTNWDEMLPASTKEELLAFTLSLRADDGYYYHPQWGTQIGSGRKGRDIGWGNDILRALGYGYMLEEDYVPEDGGNITVSLRNRAASGITSAISRVKTSTVVAASTSFEQALASKQAFINWLDEQDLSTNSYTTGNTINANISRINNAGLRPVLQQYLIEHQYPNGLWEPEVSYRSINGLMKISTSCFYVGAFPNADKAIESVMTVLGLPMSAEVESITFVYNQWEAIRTLLGSCSVDKRAEVEALLVEKAPTLIFDTISKLRVFRKGDGGFSMNQETSSPTSQNVPVAVPGSAESDVNATAIAISTLFKDIFLLYEDILYGSDKNNVSGFPSLYGEYDAYYFLDRLEELGTIVKANTFYEDPPVITFDDYDEKNGNEANGIVKYPAEGIQNWQGSDILDVEGNNKYFHSAIVDNPKPAEGIMGDKVLYATDYSYEDSEGNKDVAENGSNTTFTIQNSGMNGNCYIFESDILFGGGNNLSDCLGQLQFFTSGTDFIAGWLNVYSYVDKGVTYLRLEENFAGADGYKDKKVVTGIPIDEWFKLRIEFYKLYDESGALSYKYKIYLNGVYAGYSDSSNYDSSKGEYLERNITAFRFSYYRHSSSGWYFNNVYVAEADKRYEQEMLGGGEEITLDDEKLVHNFESGIADNDDLKTQLVYKHKTTGELQYISGGEWNRTLDGDYGIYQSNTNNKGGIRLYSDYDPTSLDNKVLQVYTFNVKSYSYNASMTVDDSVLSTDGYTWELSFDYYFSKIPWIYSGDFLTVDFTTAGGHKVAGVTFEATDFKDTHSAQKLKIRRDDGSYVSDFTLNADNWYTIKLEYYYDIEDYTHSRLKIYLVDKDGKDACISDTRSSLKAGEISQVVFGFTPYDIRGAEYFDDISLARTDKKYSKTTVYKGNKVKLPETPAKLVGASEYDFSSDIINGVRVYGYSTSSEKDDRVEYLQTSITGEAPTHPYGSAFSLVTASDGAPVKPGESVLKIQSTNTGTARQSILTLTNPDSNKSNMMHIVEYDYYFESNTGGSGATLLNLSFNNSAAGERILNLTAAKNLITHSGGYAKNALQIGGGGDSVASLAAGRWYRIRIVWDRTEDGGGRYYYYYSENGGKTYKLAVVAETEDSIKKMVKNTTVEVDSVSLVVNAYKNTGVQYIDNIRYIVADELPEYVAPEVPEGSDTDLSGGIVDGYYDEK